MTRDMPTLPDPAATLRAATEALAAEERAAHLDWARAYTAGARAVWASYDAYARGRAYGAEREAYAYLREAARADRRRHAA